jgi:hypothetical protein
MQTMHLNKFTLFLLYYYIYTKMFSVSLYILSSQLILHSSYKIVVLYFTQISSTPELQEALT